MYHFSDFVRSSGRSMRAPPGLGDGTSILQFFCLIVTSIEEYWWVWWSTSAGLWGQPQVWAEITMVVLRHQCSEFWVIVPPTRYTMHTVRSSLHIVHWNCALTNCIRIHCSKIEQWATMNCCSAVKQGVSIGIQNHFSVVKSCRHSLDKRKQQNWISWHIYFLRRAPH